LACILLPSLQAKVASASQPQSPAELRWVTELEAPEGILVQKKVERKALAEEEDGQTGLRALEAKVLELWPQIRQQDLHALSRTQVAATRGYQLPESLGKTRGRILAKDPANGLWHLELLGPRLPADFDIVHRYLAFYASYDPQSGHLTRLSATIRGWVYE
jgi:hypothetical protein